MDLINSLKRADSLRTLITCDYRVDTDLPIETIHGTKSFFQCLKKTANTLQFAINSSAFDLPPADIVFTGTPAGFDSANPLLIWDINQRLTPPITFPGGIIDITFDSVQGQITTILRPENPVLVGPGCDGQNKSFVCFFSDFGNNNQIVIQGNHGTIVTLSNIKISANIGLVKLLDIKIAAHHNHSTDCGDHFDLAGETVLIKATPVSQLLPSNLLYKWKILDVVFGGAGIVGDNNSSDGTVLVRLPATPGILKVSVEVTDIDAGFTDIFTFSMRYYPSEWHDLFYRTCDLRKIMRSRVVPPYFYHGGDPPADELTPTIYSRRDLLALSSLLHKVNTSIKNIFKADERI